MLAEVLHDRKKGWGMKKTLLTMLALSTAASMLAVPAEAKKKPKKVVRVVEARYEQPAIGSGTTGGVGLGIPQIPTGLKEVFVSIEVADDEHEESRDRRILERQFSAATTLSANYWQEAEFLDLIRQPRQAGVGVDVDHVRCQVSPSVIHARPYVPLDPRAYPRPSSAGIDQDFYLRRTVTKYAPAISCP